MAQWYHLFGLLSVLCMSFGALYIVFNSEYNEACDYSKTIDSCHELKTWRDQDMEWENRQLNNDYHIQAQDLRNQSEIEKCQFEEELLSEFQEAEKVEAQAIARKCMDDFQECVRSSFTTTAAPVAEVDCTDCDRFCDTAKWTTVDSAYANVMNFTGQCSGTVCPWLPECGSGEHIHTKCSMRGCKCNKATCPDTTTSTTTTTTTTTLKMTTSAKNHSNTTTAKTVTTTTKTTTVYQPRTSTSFTVTTSTAKATTTPTTTVTTTTTTTVKVTTTTTKAPTTTPTTTTSTTTTAGCSCAPGYVGTVIVGRPYKTFEGISHSFDAQTLTLMQGVVVDTYSKLMAGAEQTRNCREEFYNRSNYVVARQATPQARAQAAANHFDLSCGYSGTFKVKCKQTLAQKALNECSLDVDISTCQPPTYSQALDQCYTPPTTTPIPAGPTMPSVPDWLGVEELTFTLASMPRMQNITTRKTTPAPCCEVHVGSVCRTDVDVDYPGKTIQGRWNPENTYLRKEGYFPITECDRQPEDTPRQCPMVKMKVTNTAFKQWPHCMKVCNDSKAEADLRAKACDRSVNTELATKEKAAFEKKLESMKAKRKVLEDWVTERMITVTEMKQVTDCFADKLPRRYNGLSLPKLRTGFDKMPLHNECRLHGCETNQCLEVRRPCKVPFVFEPPESLCSNYEPNGTFKCVDKVTMMSNNPVSLGFGIAWMIIGSVLLCCGIWSWIRTLNLETDFFGMGETTTR